MPSALPGAPVVEVVRLLGQKSAVRKHQKFLTAVAALDSVFPIQRFRGRGIVICGGGVRYFPSAYVLIRLLRALRCELPIEVWHLGEREMSRAMRDLLAEYNVECVDAYAMRRVHPVRRLAGWELKCYSVLHSRFSEVLLLDADNCPVRDPSFHFELPEYRERGALFWPDFWRFKTTDAAWVAAGIEPLECQQFESGQMVIDKARCWRALNVAMHLNEYSDWWYRLIHGDKDTFQLAWRKIEQPFALCPHPVRAMDGVMLQHDFAGKLLFQHRNFAKWTLHENRRIAGFKFEAECLGFLEELRARWNELPPEVRRYAPKGKSPAERAAARKLTSSGWKYRRVGYGERPLTFLPDGRIGEGAAGCEVYWDVRASVADSRRLRLEVFGADSRTFTAWPDERGGWAGRWERFEGMPVELRPLVRRGPRKVFSREGSSVPGVNPSRFAPASAA